MTDVPTSADAAASDVKSLARKRGGRRKQPAVTHAPRDDDEPTGWIKIFGILMGQAIRGEVGRVIERWPVASLTELRDAIDSAIAIATEAGDHDVSLNRFDVVLAYYPRGEAKTYRVSINKPVQAVDDAG